MFKLTNDKDYIPFLTRA